MYTSGKAFRAGEGDIFMISGLQAGDPGADDARKWSDSNHLDGETIGQNVLQ
ncbi:hypothetical protein GFS60_03007 [Rhodococcus sp. WAY2]|nr:hypothetical protein GFS60_03007 [Rhodococcus sp. WAY2]